MVMQIDYGGKNGDANKFDFSKKYTLFQIVVMHIDTLNTKYDADV
jgi:hypothetical protein